MTADRINSIIKALGLTNNSFAEKLGVKNPTIDGMTKGRIRDKKRVVTKPSFEIMEKMISTFGINPLYLFEVSDDMFLKDMKQGDLNSYSTSQISINMYERKEEFRKDPVYQMHIGNEIKDAAIKLLKDKKESLQSKKSEKTN